MALDYRKCAEEIFSHLGGKDNIASAAHCATRLRLVIVDNSKVDVKAIENVNWIPEWGEDRIKGMVRDRSDWCISRQRTWGVPIPVIYCKDCGKPIYTDETIAAIADLFRKEGSDAWWTKEPEEFIPASVKCECGCNKFTKEYEYG